MPTLFLLVFNLEHSHTEAEFVASPSNYNEFYDDDEKQLIASIENDFKTTSPFALPGSVL